MNRFGSVVLCVTVGFLGLGCNRDGKTPVEGTVTWNGDPVATGHIIFAPTDTSVVPDASTIENGKFQFRATPGSKKVEIFSERAVGKPDPIMKTQVKQQFIPIRYNEKTELTAEIEMGKDNVLTFDLKEMPGDKAAGSDVAKRPTE
jgi:hypothetical protein